MSVGTGIEVACIGSEGVVGLNALAVESLDQRTGFVQVADGIVEYMPAVLFERELARNGRFREAVDRFCHAFLGTVIQAVACNSLHTIEQPCCRWLLNVHDRIGRGRFELKVRFLARALGVKNSTVAAILSSLAEQQLISHDAQSVTVLGAIGLRRLTCGCYRAMQRAYTPWVAIETPKAEGPPRAARVLHMRPGPGACTLCGSTTRVPHQNGDACILALDEEIGALVERTHTLRKYRAQLLANRAQLYSNILKRSSGRI